MTLKNPNVSSSIKYRPDVDGLRAIAVLAVILYHANLMLFSGGYIGVDIFFVISGYLITSITVNELNKDKFTFINFYIRRVKRLFPALFTLIV
ncbi:MAG: acyltransferase, partial [Desulfurella sp.]|uniref:acyltransferase family protein n=1 Tax=Desulfurella sp. TaxID=1962857 RepID=UPI000CAF0076